MYAGHQGGELLHTAFSAPDIHYDRDGKPASFWGLKGSASIKHNVITLTAVNPDLRNPFATEIILHGVTTSSVAGTVLKAGDMHAHNTFENPTRSEVNTAGGREKRWWNQRHNTPCFGGKDSDCDRIGSARGNSLREVLSKATALRAQFALDGQSPML